MKSSQPKDSLLQRCGILFTLSAFAIAQPIYDLFGRNAEFFVIRRSEPVDLIALILVFSLGIPLLFSLIILLLSRISGRLGKLSFSLISFSLITLTFLPLFVRIEAFGNWWALVPALALAGIVLGLLSLFAVLRSFLSFLSISAFIFPLLFVSNVEILKLIRGETKEVVSFGSAAIKKPVVMVVFDEFPMLSLLDSEGQIDGESFPGFKALSDTSWWFKNASTLSSWTERAVPIILTGKLPNPAKKEIPSFDEHPDNLFTLLGASHQMKVFEQVTDLCPESLCSSTQERASLQSRVKSLLEDSSVVYLHLVSPKGISSRLPDISFAWNDFAEQGKQVKKKPKRSKKGILDKGLWGDDDLLFKEFLDSFNAGEEPTLHFIHITFPHVPYQYLPSGKRYTREAERKNDLGYVKKWGSDPWPGIQQNQRYYLQLAYADSLIQQLLSRLKEQKLFDDSLLIVTADHGVSFRPGEYSRRLSSSNVEDILLTPLFVKLPAQSKPELSLRNVETIDIVPTVADVLKVRSSQVFDGVSMLDLNAPERLEKSFYALESGAKEAQKFPAHLSEDTYLKIQREIFGTQSKLQGLFTIGPAKDLLGTLAGEVTHGQALKIVLDLEQDYQEVDLNSRYIPAFITGEFATTEIESENVVSGTPLLVAVNGVIQAGTYAAANRKGELGFRAMVKESAFTNGANSIEIFKAQ